MFMLKDLGKRVGNELFVRFRLAGCTRFSIQIDTFDSFFIIFLREREREMFKIERKIEIFIENYNNEFRENKNNYFSYN
jgi:hypothetical protein